MKKPCDLGFVCPCWGYEDDSGMGLCKCPDVTEKEGRHNVYPYVMNLEECPLVNVDTPIEKWLKSMDKKTDYDEDRICPKCGKVMVLCEDEKTYYQIWECDGCGYKESE